MPHISNRRPALIDEDKALKQEMRELLLKDSNIRSLDEDKTKAMVKHLNKVVLWLLEHQNI